MKALIVFHLVLLWTFLAPSITASPFGDPSDSIVRNHRRLSATATTASTFLSRRRPNSLGDGWWMYYDTWTTLLPWQDASEGIEAFFQAISDQANSIWRSRDPQNYLEVVQGDLTLEFFAELQPIPWQFVAGFADTMRRALDLGFAGMFDMRIVAPTGIVVYVHLRVRQPEAAVAA